MQSRHLNWYSRRQLRRKTRIFQQECRCCHRCCHYCRNRPPAPPLVVVIIVMHTGCLVAVTGGKPRPLATSLGEINKAIKTGKRFMFSKVARGPGGRDRMQNFPLLYNIIVKDRRTDGRSHTRSHTQRRNLQNRVFVSSHKTSQSVRALPTKQKKKNICLCTNKAPKLQRQCHQRARQPKRRGDHVTS